MITRESVSRRPPSAMTLVVAALFLTAGCGGDPEPIQNVAAPAQPAKAGAAATRGGGAASASDISNAEAEAFAKKLQDAFAAGDEAAIGRLIDWTRVADRACNKLPASDEELKGMKHGLTIGLSGRAKTGVGFVPEIMRNCSQGGDYSCVRVEEKDGQWHALFRLVVAEGGLNYHRYLLERAPRGDVVASDFYIHATGEFISNTARKMLLTMLSGRSKSILARLTGADRDLIAGSDTMAKMSQARVQGRFDEVLRLYDTLPKNLQRSKACLIMKVMAAQHTDAQQYVAAMHEFSKLFPGDSALALILLDYHFVKEEYDEALKTIEQFDADVRDPYLNILRANAHHSKGDLPNARKYIDLFVAEFPQFMGGHDIQSTIAVAQGDFPAVTKALKVLHRDFNIDPLVAADLPAFAPYKASEEYKELERYAKGGQ